MMAGLFFLTSRAGIARFLSGRFDFRGHCHVNLMRKLRVLQTTVMDQFKGSASVGPLIFRHPVLPEHALSGEVTQAVTFLIATNHPRVC